ncbi:MAG: long-chain fatty acid--CoA ligase [Acidobacteriia bacterium]|nr:long-chain fatty acid--CoA ligase [Terriglobia bacterium]
MSRTVNTLADLPFHIAERFPHRAVLRHCRGDAVIEKSGAELFEQVRDVSFGLSEFGLQAGDRVAVIAESRPAWCITDLAVLAAGGVTVPVYPTLPAGQVCYILNDCGAKIAVVSNHAQSDKLASVPARLARLATVVVMDTDGRPRPSGAPTLADVAARGRKHFLSDPAAGGLFEKRAAAIARDALATIIYTSGTTGEPKGVMLTHRNLVSNIEAAVDMFGVTREDVALSFLPLSHAFERMVLYMYLCAGASVTFAESPDTLARDMVNVRPTLMTAVPRVFEKLHARIQETVAQASALRRSIFHWAVGVGLRRSARVRSGRRVGTLLAMQDRLADKVVFRDMRERTGGRLRVLVSGSAPLPRAIAEFFDAIGLTIFEGYGLTEASPVLTVNPLDRPKFGTVGRALPGVEMRIADDGEILARGPNVMRGYYHRPDATRAVLEPDGWLHTGDIGSLDAEGYLTITDRKEDLILTSVGKRVAPQSIESELRRHPLIAEAVLVGDRRKFIAALLVPDFPALQRRLAALNRPAGTRDVLAARPDVIALFQEAVDAVNAGRAPFETIRRFALIPSEFTIETGEVTPTMKVKRRVIEERWRAVIETLYEEGERPLARSRT